MGYRSLQECVEDLMRTGQLVRIPDEIDPYLEAAAIHRHVHQAGGPALLFERVKGTPFRMVSNLFGTLERARWLFRDTWHRLETFVQLKIDPVQLLRAPHKLLALPWWLRTLRVRRVRSGPVMSCRTYVDHLPQLTSWPGDGGPFITLPLVYTEDPEVPGIRHSNLGMYRIQLAGNRYETPHEVGLHYQLHRGIGIHHAKALRQGQALKVNVFVGGPPAMTLAAVMPLPEGMSELHFAGLLGARPIRMIKRPSRLPIWADADFCITGYVRPSELKPEGPFGDHLGYYSLQHDFPVLHVEEVWHRPHAIWPFTVVGRPPQEDTIFGKLIHDLTGPIIPTVLPGIRAVHAVDAAGVHPLLLVLGSERYVPYDPQRQPRELLTQACAVLGQGQLSLAKYLWIAAAEDCPALDIHDISGYFRHMLARVDWTRDIHFLTRTTIDTLDYSGEGLNVGSKVIIAAAGPQLRVLPTSLEPLAGLSLPEGFHTPQVCIPGVLAVSAPPRARCSPWLRRSNP